MKELFDYIFDANNDILNIVTSYMKRNNKTRFFTLCDNYGDKIEFEPDNNISLKIPVYNKNEGGNLFVDYDGKGILSIYIYFWNEDKGEETDIVVYSR